MLLANAAVVRLTQGDLEAADALNEEAVSLSAPGSYARLRALTNLAVSAILDGAYEVWRPRYDRAVDAATRAGSRANLLWLEGQRIDDAVFDGRWDEALHRADTFFGEGVEHYQVGGMLLLRSWVLASRGLVREALELRDRALEIALSTEEAQSRIPGLLWSAWTSLLVGDAARSRELIERAEPAIAATAHRAPGVSAGVGFAVVAAGAAERYLELHADCVPTRRVVALRLGLAGRVAEAADAWSRVSRYDEAIARLHAASVLTGAEADVQLQRALAFFRAVGATKVVADAEPLAAAAAAE